VARDQSDSGDQPSGGTVAWRAERAYHRETTRFSRLKFSFRGADLGVMLKRARIPLVLSSLALGLVAAFPACGSGAGKAGSPGTGGGAGAVVSGTGGRVGSGGVAASGTGGAPLGATGGSVGQGGTGGRAAGGGISGSGGSAVGGRGAGATATGGAGGDASGGSGIGGVGGATGASGAPGSGGGAMGNAGATGSTVEVPPGYVPAIMAVGYGGMRIVSRDGGKTWGDRTFVPGASGDDQDLLRAVVYGKGLWVATGWKLVTSNDGVNWTDHGLIAAGPIPKCNIVEGLAYKDGYFFAACNPWDSPGAVFRSSDGLAWTKYSNISPDTGGHLYMTYRGGKFVAYGDSLTSYQSDDALTWTVLLGVQEATYCQDTFMSLTACHQAAWFEGVWLREQWPAKIVMSADGTTFNQVYLDDVNNTLYESRAIVAGYVAPH